jgi:PPOX class probable F420-dependent enzyme
MPTPAPAPVPAPATVADLAREEFVSLTTFRRSGAPVSTPVWVAPDGDALVVTTPADSGKVKRLRHTARVELRPCGRGGGVADGVEPTAAVAQVLIDPAEHERHTRALRGKYGLQYRAMMVIERVLARRTRPRVILRITAPA